MRGASTPSSRGLPVRRAPHVAAGFRRLVPRRRRRHQPAARGAHDVPDADCAPLLVGIDRAIVCGSSRSSCSTLEAAMIGVFVSLDLFLFYVFWDAMLIPMYFLIGDLGLRPAHLRGHQVHPVHDGGQRADAARDHLAGVSPPGRHRRPELRPRRSLALDVPRRRPDVAVPGVRRRVRDQGAALPVPHVAARCARAGADGRLGHPGRRAAEDGHLRPAAVRVPALPGSGARVRAVARGAGGRSALSTARSWRWSSPT